MTASRLSSLTTRVGHPGSRRQFFGQVGDSSVQEVELHKGDESLSDAVSADTVTALTAQRKSIDDEKVIIEGDEGIFDLYPIPDDTLRYLELVKTSSIGVERKLSIRKDYQLETYFGTPKYENIDEVGDNLPNKPVARPAQRSMPVFLKVEKIDPISSGFMASINDRGDVFSLGRDVSARLNIPRPNRDHDVGISEVADSMEAVCYGCDSFTNPFTVKSKAPRSRRRGKVNFSQSSIHHQVDITGELKKSRNEELEVYNQKENDIQHAEKYNKSKTQNATASKNDKIYGAQNVEIVYSPTIK
ncbi:hypothetical protein ACHAXS_006601 [Conticribra weissflogii]